MEKVSMQLAVIELNDKDIPDLVRLPVGTPFPLALPMGSKITDVHLGFDTVPDPKIIGQRVVAGQSGRMLYYYPTENEKRMVNRFFILCPHHKRIELSNESILVFLGSYPVPRSADFMCLFEISGNF